MRLLSFSISNFRSFSKEQTIRFDNESKNVDAILGPNGSGKSNLFMALGFYRDFIRNSTNYEGQSLQYSPFLLSSEYVKRPTSFQAEIQIFKHVYKYHFSLLAGRVLEEALSRKTFPGNTSYETIFSRRSLQKKYYDKNGFDSSILGNTRDDALVITKAWENNNKYALDVFKWLEHLKLVSGTQPIDQTAQNMLENSNFKIRLLDLLRRADLYIQDVTVAKVNLPNDFLESLPFKDEYKKSINTTGFNVTTTHMLRDGGGSVIGTKQLPMAIESEGTKRIFELAFPILDTLEKGNILYIDEFETHLHPKECKLLVELFTSTENNSKAQLIINTHNTQIMDRLNRNNIHLFGKNSLEETVIGNIPKDIRINDPAIERKYNKGMFGAVPNIGK